MLYDPKWDKPVTVSDLLLRTAEFLELHKWGKAPEIYIEAEPLTRTYCAITAMMAVAREPEQVGGAHALLRRHVGGSVVVWNDAPARTKAEVISTLRQVAGV